MVIGKRRLKKTLDDVGCRNYLKELISLVRKQNHHGLSEWTNPTHNPQWGGVLSWRKDDPASENHPNDLHIGIHTGDGKDGCNKPALLNDSPLLVVRVGRNLSPKTVNRAMRSGNEFKSYHRTSREETEEFDAFYISGPKTTATVAKIIRPLLESFSKRL